jgi:hypothetical protein
MLHRPILPLACAALLAIPLAAQSRLPQMPGYEQWRAVGGQISSAMHSGVNPQRMMEFFIERLVLQAPAVP